ncbi:MAG: GPW/gp25 family protein [Thalassolituus sp.]
MSSRTPTPNIQSWPLGQISVDGRMSWSTDDNSVRESMLNILLTRPGERLQRPEFGAGLMKFVHQPNNETTRNLIAGVVRKSLTVWETRVVIDGVDVTPARENLAEVHINIRYHLRHNQVPSSLGLRLNLGV